MITPEHAQLMARYNSWQNRSLYTAAERLPDSERRRDTGAFFGSIHRTLCHLLSADQLWMHRFAAAPAPKARTIAEGASIISDWDELKRKRVELDRVIEEWTKTLDPRWFDTDLTYHSIAFARDFTFPRWIMVTHFFNHQTHHRGQVHCLLTQAGIKPEDTDIPVMSGLA